MVFAAYLQGRPRWGMTGLFSKVKYQGELLTLKPHLLKPLGAWSSSRWTGFCQNTFSRVKSPPYALTPCKTALMELPSHMLKDFSPAHRPLSSE